MTAKQLAQRFVALSKEPSSYRGLVWIMTACGISVSPDLATVIMAAGAGVAGLIGFLIKD